MSTARERAEEPDALQRAKELAAKYIPLQNWDPVNEEPVETYGYPETQRHGFQQGYLAFHAKLLARDAETTEIDALHTLSDTKWKQEREAISRTVDPLAWRNIDHFMADGKDLRFCWPWIKTPLRRADDVLWLLGFTRADAESA